MTIPSTRRPSGRPPRTRTPGSSGSAWTTCGSAAGRAAEPADPGLTVGTRGQALTAGGYLLACVLEWTLRHLGLVARLPDAPRPPAEGLARSREPLERIAGTAFPASFPDPDALLLGTGRRVPADGERSRPGPVAARLPFVIG